MIHDTLIESEVYTCLRERKEKNLPRLRHALTDFRNVVRAVLTLSAVIFGGCRDGNHNDVTASTATTVEANATSVTTEPTDAVDTTAKKNIISNQPAAETTEPAPTDLDLLYPDDVAEIRQRMDVTGDILGVAFVCYVDSDAELPIVQDKIRYSFFESEYTVTNRMTDKQFILDTDGAEIYAVIPKNKNCTVKSI